MNIQIISILGDNYVNYNLNINIEIFPKKFMIVFEDSLYFVLTSADLDLGREGCGCCSRLGSSASLPVSSGRSELGPWRPG